MKIKFQNSWSRFLAAFLGLLGFITACESADLYGCPYASFKINGTVTDQDNKPLQNAKLRYFSHSYAHARDSVYTSPDGTFQLSDDNYSGGSMLSIVTTCEGYQKDSTVIELNFEGKKKKDEWYSGHCDATFNPVLTKLPDPETNDNNDYK